MITKFWSENKKGTISLGIPWSRYEDNIRMDLGETGWKYVKYIHLTQGQGPIVGPCEHYNDVRVT